MKSAGKARSNGLYRHIRTSKEIIRNLLNDLDNTTATSSALNTEQLLTVDTPTLCKLLCCGRYTAIQIGDLAHARIVTNSRVLWSVQRIKEYVYKIAC